MTVVISPAIGDEDAAACASMMAASPPWTTLGIGYDAALKVVSNPDRTVLIGRDGGVVVGFCVIDLTSTFRGYIQILCVREDHRGKGIGASLIQHAEEAIFAVSPNVFLCVSSFNANAKRFYERLGYIEVGELTDYIVPGASELLMRKTIGSWREFRAMERSG